MDCIRLAISLGGDADTLAAIAGPMAYAFYREMPDDLVYKAMKTLPDWMVDVNDRFDAECDRSKCYPSFSVPLVFFPDKID